MVFTRGKIFKPSPAANPGRMEGKEMERLSLMDITGQESGIVVYDDEVIVTNWSQYDPDRLPVLSPIGTVMAWPQDEPLKVIEEYHVDDVRDALPGKIVRVAENEIATEGMEIVSDENGDIPALWGFDIGAGAYIDRDTAGNLIPTSGTVYCLENAIVIAPDGWC